MRDGCACFAVGTGDDGVTPNPCPGAGCSAVAALAIPAMARHAELDLATVDSRLAVGDGHTCSDAGSAVCYYFHLPHLAAAAWAALAERHFNPFTASAALP